MRTIILLLLSAVLPASAAKIGAGDLECYENADEKWSEAAVQCTPLRVASHDPMCGGYPGHYGDDTREVFAKLAPLSGVPDVKLVYRDDPKKHPDDCAGGGASAWPGSKKSKKPPTIYMCANAFLSIRNVHQLAATLGHELAHLSHDHTAKGAKHELKLFKDFAAAQAKSFWQLPKSQQLAAARKAVCPDANKLFREQEHEADDDGLALMKLAGYDAVEGAKFHVYDQDIAAAVAKVLRPNKESSHPTDSERIGRSARTAESLGDQSQ